MPARELFPELVSPDDYEATGKTAETRDWVKALRVLAASVTAGFVIVLLFRAFGAT